MRKLNLKMKCFLKINKYKFLLSQLVSREFKTKYKRSILGIFWSLLNPLLIMTVQYMVFSELFRWDINNFAIYLLSGTVMFNFFQEATSQALGSITGNASLITKVYVPLYIFPVSKVLSSCINLGFSLVALFMLVIIQGLKFNIYYLMIPYGIFCMITFAMGMSFLLSAMMVYFRDIQFLYGVILTAWTYLTPLFYPETILPDRFMIFMQCNPMYHFIRYIRNIILDGSIPTVRAHILCLIFAVIPLWLGLAIFKRVKSNFILNI